MSDLKIDYYVNLFREEGNSLYKTIIIALLEKGLNGTSNIVEFQKACNCDHERCCMKAHIENGRKVYILEF